MRSLLPVESLDLSPSNQYILVRVIPSCFHSVKMCLRQVIVTNQRAYLQDHSLETAVSAAFTTLALSKFVTLFSP
jgi:hypothetical protein